MRNKLSKDYFLLLLWLSLAGFASAVVAGPEMATPEEIVMKSPDTFIVNEREVASADLIKALKKNKISPSSPLVIEVPSGTPITVIKELTQKLATAGFKPFFKYPRHADASVKDPKASAPPPLTPPKKQRWRK